MAIERDLDRINNARTLDDIRAVVREYPANAYGNGATLYSGAVGKTSANRHAAEYARLTRSSIIDTTPRGLFLVHEKIALAIKTSAKRIFESQGAGNDLAEKLRDDFLYGDAKAPRDSHTSIFNCLWCEASHDFAASLSGDVKVIAVSANPHRVFAQVEIPTALHNPNVRSLGGVPVESLRATYAERGVDGVLARVQAAYAEEAIRAGALPAPVADPTAAVRRAPGMRFNIGQATARGLGVASAAASLHDGVTAVRHAAQLHDQGNDVGAQSRMVGAVSRNVGGWGGVALGAKIGAAVTSETGPGAFIGAALGGVAGAIAGDQLAAWIDHHRIHQQTDSDGRRWQLDPAQPAQGWTRTVTGDLDRQATVDRGIPVYAKHTVVASPEVADRLNYLASSRAVELALATPPPVRDPFVVPSTPETHRPDNVYEGDWQREPVSGQWSRQVTDSRVGLSMQRFDVETATHEEAVALDRQAQAIVTANIQAMPASTAAHYKAAYDQFGWSRHGEMPAAVDDALAHPERMVASDGHVYTRGDDARWTTPDLLHGHRVAEGNRHVELEATYRRHAEAVTAAVEPLAATPRTQREIYSDAMIEQFCEASRAGDRDAMRSIAKTFATSDVGKEVRAGVSQNMLDRQQALPGRDHPLFQQALHHLDAVDPDVARYRDEAGRERLAGAIAFEATCRRMRSIDAIVPNANGELVATCTNRGADPFSPAATVDPTLAAVQPLDRSFQQLADETQAQVQEQALQQERAQSQSHGMAR